MSLSREVIVDTAVSLLDEHGLDGLTLRRLAKQLGVSAPTLYWHVDDKRHLLDLMAEAIYREADIPSHPRDGQPWWEWLEEAARGQRAALLAHRDAALVVAGNRPTEGSFDYIEDTLTNLVAVGFPPIEALRVVLSIGDYVLGSALEYQASVTRGEPSERERELYHAIFVSNERPTWAAAAASIREGGDWLEDSFETGLTCLITGLRARHAALTGVVTTG